MEHQRLYRKPLIYNPSLNRQRHADFSRDYHAHPQGAQVRAVFYVSDSTGITAATLGQALLSQFDDLDYESVTAPFVTSEDKIQRLVQEINAIAERNAVKPLVFCTFGNGRLRDQLRYANALVLDLMHDFIKQLEHELGLSSNHALGHFHAVLTDLSTYENRINAVDYTIAHDDGIRPHHYADAELVLIGISRTGKHRYRFTSRFSLGIKVANYPLTDSELGASRCRRCSLTTAASCSP